MNNGAFFNLERNKQLNKHLSGLIKIQENDFSVRDGIAKKNEIPKKMSILSDEFKKRAEKLENAKANVSESAKRHKEKETALIKANDDLRKTKSKQFDVKTNKEFEAVLKEMEVIEERIGNTENDIIAILDEIECAKSVLVQEENTFKEYAKEHEADKRKSDELIRYLDEEIKKLNTTGEEIRKDVSPDVLKKYEAVKALHGVMAVAPVIKGVCQGCFMNIPPQLNNELIVSDNIILCPRCNRIIFYQKSE